MVLAVLVVVLEDNNRRCRGAMAANSLPTGSQRTTDTHY